MERSNSKRNTSLICLGLVLLTLAAFEPLRHNELVNYDDNQYIINNPHIKEGITWQSVKWAFSTPLAANWHPLTWLSHTLDYQLFGLKPWGHHLVNLLFHLANTLLLFLVLKSMTRAIWPSAFVAAAFALHPLHVESVAWAAERKDVLSTFFWMLTMAAYVRYSRGPSIVKYILIVLFLALGLMAKPMLVTLPFVLLLLDFWPLKRFQKAQESSGKKLAKSQTSRQGFAQESFGRLVIEKIPLFVLVVGSCIVTYIVQQQGGAVSSFETVSIKLRIANALTAYFGYISKMFYPNNLAVLYSLLTAKITLGGTLLCALPLAVISAVVIYLSRRRGYLAVGWLWYLGTLIPVIGLVQVGSASMADRYTYVSLIGIFIMITWGGADILAKWRLPRGGAIVIVSILIVAMVGGTRRQVRYWRDSYTLFGHATEISDDNYLAHYFLGVVYGLDDRYEEAIGALKQSLDIKWNESEAHYNLGLNYGRLNRHKEAADALKHAIGFNPKYADAHNSLGISFFNLKRHSEAIVSLNEALRINPVHEKANYNLGYAYSALGRYPEAIDAYQRSLGINPDDAQAYLDMAVSFSKLGRYQQQIEALKQALRIKPNDVKVYLDLGIACEKLGREPEAIDFYKQTIRIEPNDSQAYLKLGMIYGNLGRFPEAIDSLKKVIAINPDNALAHNLLGMAFNSLGLSREALGAFKEAIRIRPDFVDFYLSLAVTYGNLGNYNKMAESLKQAIDIKPDNANAHYLLAVAYLKKGNKNSAWAEYEILKKLNEQLGKKLFEVINK